MEFQDRPADPRTYLPEREQPRRMFCVCVLVMPDPRGLIKDSCAAVTSGPDEPVCQMCVDAGHPDLDNFRPEVKN
jgi:hypothetical protein